MSMDLVMDKKEPSVHDHQESKEKEGKEEGEHYHKSMKYWKKTMDQIYSMYPDTR
jgi:hypothetical protein